ncbi:MAG: hypothetical protein ABIJ40_06760 [Bacteroidota bacterium]
MCFSKCIHSPGRNGFTCKTWFTNPLNAGKAEVCKTCKYYFKNTRFSFLGGILIWSILLSGTGIMLYVFSKLTMLAVAYFGGF